MKRLLIVEDEPRQRDALVKFLHRRGYEVEAFEAGEPALEALRERHFAILLTDLRLPGVDGIEVVRRAKQIDERIGALITTAYASVDTAVEALRVGAHDYLLKPLFFEELERKISHLLEHRDLERQNAQLRAMVATSTLGNEVIGISDGMAEVRDWIGRAAPTTATVLITGETGTGKEVVAHAIHALGPNAEHPMLAINVAALPRDTVESELFGHVRGAYTGADHARDGILRAAGSGTVFLDEIGDLDPEIQAKLLRALEARQVMPLGSDRAIPFEARILAATHRNLAQRVADGRFREDLFYRLNVLEVPIPPLRDRPEDVPPLTDHLLAKLARRNGVAAPRITPAAMRMLCRYRWPGNVRELANVLERGAILAAGGELDRDHLPADVRGEAGDDLSLAPAVARFERDHIALVLRMCDGHRDRAARELGLSPATLYRRLEKLDLKGYGLADRKASGG